MADVNANIGVNIDTSNALSQLKALQRQISQFHTSIAKSSETAALAQRDLQRNFINGVNAIGAFSAELRTIKTTAESFTDALEKNKFSMREYFRFAGASTKTFGKLFRSEFDTINKVAEENVKRLQTQYIKMGRDASGAMRAIAIMPNELDMSKMSTQLQMAAQRQALFNQLVKQGSTNLLNFGKNTQWAGRQLMVGFTLPLASLGTIASRTFMDMETAALKFRKVYGDLFTPAAEREQALADIGALGEMFTKYGISVASTVGLAAEAAAAGFQGLDLQRQTQQATRLSVLGQIEQQKALETTISLQNAFKMSSEDLASSIDFLNAVENQTVVSLDDITTAIPKVAPVIQQLGGDVKDLAFFMAAMKEGGVNASEGANALKSGLAALINPTEKASDMLASMGINIKQIVEANRGDLKGTVIDFARALDTLEPLTRARAIEQLFGKFQFARLSTLFDNVTNQTGQAARVLDLAGTSIEELASLSESELGMTADSAMNKFRKSVEDLKLSLVPVGQSFLEAVTPIVEFIGGILEKFNDLSSGTKKAITLITVAIGAIGPVALMTFGLIANGAANLIKGFLVLRNGYLRLTGQSQILSEQTEFLTIEQQRAAAVAHSLDQSHARLTQTFNAEAGAVRALANEYRSALGALQGFAQRNPGMMLPPKKYNKGVVIVPGSGNKDTVPAMLTPGESIIPADMTQKYGALIQGMIAGNIPGYQEGRLGTARAHLTMPFAPGSEQFTRGIQMAGLQELASKYPQFIKVVSNLIAELPQSLNILLEKGSASIQEFSSQWSARTNKMLSSVKAGGENIQDPEIIAALDMVEQEIHDRTVAMAEGTEDQKVSDELLSQATREVIDKYKGMSSALGRVTTALDNASQQVGQVRIQPRSAQPGVRNTDYIRAGLASGEFTQTGGNIYAGGVPIARESQSQPGKLRPASSFNPAGSYTRQEFRSQPRQVVDTLINQTKLAAGTQSPSKRTIPIGEDIARGLSVGMMNQIDDVAQVGEQVSAGAVRGVSRGARTRGPVTPGTDFPVEKTRGGVPMQQVANAAIISQATKNSAEDMVKSARSFQDRMTSLNRTIMGGTFALGSLSGLASLSGGKLGEFAGTISKLNLAMFALMSITQMLTQTQFLALAAKRAETAGLLASGKFNTALFSGGIKKLIPNLLNFGKVILRFLGPIGLVVTGLTAAYSIIKMVNAAREKERLAIEGLGDAALLTKDKLKTLGDFFGVVPQTTRLERTGPSLIVNKETRSQLDALRENQEFQETFAKDIDALSKASNKQAELIFKSLAIQLKGKGFAKEQIDLIIKALQEESGKTSIKLDFASLDLTTPEGQAEIKKVAEDLGKSFGKQFSEGYSAETKNAVSLATGEIVTWTEEKVSKGLKKSVSTTSKAIAGLFNGLSGQISNGSITAEQFNQSFAGIADTISTMPQPQAMFLLDNVLKNMPGDLAKTAAGIKNVSDQLLIAKAAALGVATITPAMIKALQIASTSADGGAQRAAARVRTKIKGDMAAVQELLDLVTADIKTPGTGTGTGDGEKSDYQKAIEQLKQQRKELLNTNTAYNKLKAAGVDTARAFEIAQDPILASAIASTKVGTKKWKELLVLIKDVNGELAKAELKKFFETRDAEVEFNRNFAAIIPTLQSIGLKAEDIKDILGDPALAKEFMSDLKDGQLNSEKLKNYIQQIPELKRIELLLEVKTVEEQFNDAIDKAMEYFDVQTKKVQAEYEPKILDAEKEVEAAQRVVDGINQEIEDIQDQISKDQRSIEMNFDRPIEALQEQISDLQRRIELEIDRPIEELNRQIEVLQRNIEMQFDRPIAALQEESSDLANDLSLIDKAAEAINEKYDAQEKALQKVSEINQEIIAQDKQRLSIADALTQGDIAAAAQAAQDARTQAAEAAAGRAGGVLQAAREAEISRLRAPVSGLTREQIEARQFQIGQQIFLLEEQREAVQAQILSKQDAIYALEQKRLPLLEQIRGKEDEIYALEEKREAAVLSIRQKEDAIYKIQQERLVPAQQELDKKQAALKAVQDELKSRLDAIDLERKKWELADLALKDAKTKSQEYNDALKAGVGLVGDIAKGWDAVAKAAEAAAAAIAAANAAKTPQQSAAQKAYDADLAKVRSMSFGDARQLAFEAFLKKYPTGRPLMYGGKVKKMAYGGIVPGTGMTDKVPTLLTPGEFVVNKPATKSFGNLLTALNESKYPSILARKVGMSSAGSNMLNAPSYAVSQPTFVNTSLTQPLYRISSPTIISSPVNSVSPSLNDNSSTVYNYNVGITVGGSSTSPDNIARAVINELKYVDSQRIRGQRA